MTSSPLAYVAVAAALWAGILALGLVARRPGSPAAGACLRLPTVLKLWGWIALVVAMAAIGSTLAGAKGLAVAVMLLVFASVPLFARDPQGGAASR